MTREEAIKIFKGFKFLPREMKAVDMAIKALEQEPCEDAVSREAVKNILLRQKFISYEAYLRCIAEIDNLPSVTPTRKKGKWIRHYCNNGNLHHIECSNCHDWHENFLEHKYCPNCGADMRGGEDGSN